MSTTDQMSIYGNSLILRLIPEVLITVSLHNSMFSVEIGMIYSFSVCTAEYNNYCLTNTLLLIMMEYFEFSSGPDFEIV